MQQSNRHGKTLASSPTLQCKLYDAAYSLNWCSNTTSGLQVKVKDARLDTRLLSSLSYKLYIY